MRKKDCGRRLNFAQISVCLAAFLFVACVAQNLLAQSRASGLTPVIDPRSDPELTICSQNLENFGQYADSKLKDSSLSKEDYEVKTEALVSRFLAAKCDVVAVQELLGKDEREGKVALEILAASLKRRSNRVFEAITGPSNDRLLRLGFLVAKDRASIKNWVSYARVELPKITTKEKARFFSRGPLEIQLDVKPQGESFTKTVALVTFHFKSHAGKSADPTQLEWETYRMQMAEALRRVIEARYAKSTKSGEVILAVLGDRNSNFDVASAKILEGVVTLKDFQAGGSCRLSKRGVPLCQAGAANAKKLFSVLTLDPQTKLRPGTFDYKGVYSWLDDIVMAPESLGFAQAGEGTTGDYDSGVVYEPKIASDHALVYVRLNW